MWCLRDSDTSQASGVNPELGIVVWQPNRNNLQTIYDSFWHQLQTIYPRLTLIPLFSHNKSFFSSRNLRKYENAHLAFYYVLTHIISIIQDLLADN